MGRKGGEEKGKGRRKRCKRRESGGRRGSVFN